MANLFPLGAQSGFSSTKVSAGLAHDPSPSAGPGPAPGDPEFHLHHREVHFWRPPVRDERGAGECAYTFAMRVSDFVTRMFEHFLSFPGDEKVRALELATMWESSLRVLKRGIAQEIRARHLEKDSLHSRAFVFCTSRLTGELQLSKVSDIVPAANLGVIDVKHMTGQDINFRRVKSKYRDCMAALVLSAKWRLGSAVQSTDFFTELVLAEGLTMNDYMRLQLCAPSINNKLAECYSKFGVWNTMDKVCGYDGRNAVQVDIENILIRAGQTEQQAADFKHRILNGETLSFTFSYDCALSGYYGYALSGVTVHTGGPDVPHYQIGRDQREGQDRLLIHYQTYDINNTPGVPMKDGCAWSRDLGLFSITTMRHPCQVHKYIGLFSQIGVDPNYHDGDLVAGGGRSIFTTKMEIKVGDVYKRGVIKSQTPRVIYEQARLLAGLVHPIEDIGDSLRECDKFSMYTYQTPMDDMGSFETMPIVSMTMNLDVVDDFYGQVLDFQAENFMNQNLFAFEEVDLVSASDASEDPDADDLAAAQLVVNFHYALGDGHEASESESESDDPVAL